MTDNPTTSDSEAEELATIVDSALAELIYTPTLSFMEHQAIKHRIRDTILARFEQHHQARLAQAEIKGQIKEVANVGAKAAKLLLTRGRPATLDAQMLLDDCVLREEQLQAQLKAAEENQ